MDSFTVTGTKKAIFNLALIFSLFVVEPPTS